MELITLTEGIKPDRASETETHCQKEALPLTLKEQAGKGISRSNKLNQGELYQQLENTQKTAWDSTFSHFAFINAILLKVHVLNIDF